MKNDDREIFKVFRVPGPPDGLKRRILDDAGEAIDKPVAAPFWDVLWESRAVRVAWAVATITLIAAHIAISLPADSPMFSGRATARSQVVELEDELDLRSVEIAPRVESWFKDPFSGRGRRTHE